MLIALTELGHEVSVATVGSGAEMERAVDVHRPDLVACPFLKTFIPESIWSRHRCLIVHPGRVGDRGPSSLDWAIELGAEAWGVTVLEANGELDGDPCGPHDLPPARLVGSDITERLVGPPFAPIGTRHAVEIGLIDAAFGASQEPFRRRAQLIERLARERVLDRRLEHKRRQRAADERMKPMSADRGEELARSHRSFVGEGSGYHEARHRFVRKLPGA
jgi:hypothetical protein